MQKGHPTSAARTNYLLIPACLLLILLVLSAFMLPSSALILANRSLELSTSEISATSVYQLGFGLPTAGTYGSLVIEACSNDPLPSQPCTVPGGFDISQAVLSAQTGPGGFNILPGATANRLVLGRVPAMAAAGAVSYTLQQVINPSTPGPYYIRLMAYASPDGSGSVTWEGGLAFAATNSLSISATVPPYLVFCTGITIANLNCTNATGDYIDFGELSSARASSGSSQMLAATNAQDGYNISVSGTTMTSGTNIITALGNNDVSRPGTAQFGLNLHANSAPAGGLDPTGPGVALPLSPYFQANSYRFNSGDTLVSYPQPDDVREYTASYIVNVPKSQPAGIYVTTLTYTCLGSF